MENAGYIVRFVRRDNLPDEEYAYWDKADAEHHFDLFLHDDSGLYRKICLLSWTGNETGTIKEIRFA